MQKVEGKEVPFYTIVSTNTMYDLKLTDQLTVP
jgi:hypothetical protein